METTIKTALKAKRVRAHVDEEVERRRQEARVAALEAKQRAKEAGEELRHAIDLTDDEVIQFDIRIRHCPMASEIQQFAFVLMPPASSNGPILTSTPKPPTIHTSTTAFQKPSLCMVCERKLGVRWTGS